MAGAPCATHFRNRGSRDRGEATLPTIHWRSLNRDQKTALILSHGTREMPRGDIAAAIAASGVEGVSKNVVIGHAHRWIPHWKMSPRQKNDMLARRAKAMSREAEERPRPKAERRNPVIASRLAREAQRVSTVSQVIEEAEPPLMLALEDLERNSCRYIYGDPKRSDYGFCGHPKREGSPYCAAHHRICHDAWQPGRAA